MRARSLRRGSITISLVPLRIAFLRKVAATGWFTVGLAPIRITTDGLRDIHDRIAHGARADALQQRGDARGVAQPRAVIDIVAAESQAHQLLEQVRLFVAALRRAESCQRLAAVGVAQLAQRAAAPGRAPPPRSPRGTPA